MRWPKSVALLFSASWTLTGTSHAAEISPDPKTGLAAETSDEAQAQPKSAQSKSTEPQPQPAADGSPDPNPTEINPYAPGAPDWSMPSEVTKQPKKESPPKEKKPSQTFEEKPTDQTLDTGHVVPTTSWGQKSAEDPAPPFSVGGVTAQVSKDTWFKFYGFIQTRYVFGRHRNDSGQLASGGGFSVPRVRLFYYGRLTDWLRVLVRVGASSDGSVSFEQAFADFQLKMLSFRVGQFNLPLFQEQTPSPVNIQGLNYAAVGSVFDGGQTQGLRITWAKDKSTVNLFITDGMRAGFAEVASPQVADIALSSRVQTRFGPGSAAQFDTGSSFRGDKLAVLLGTTVHYQSGGSLQDNAAQLGLISGDVTFERNGVSFSTSAAVMNTEASDGSRVYNVGTVIRAGAFVLPWTELFARYEGLVATKSETNPQTLFRGATGGINQYIWPARGIRVVADFVYYFDPTVGSPVQPDPNAGLFESSGPQWTARFQFNVLF